MEAALTNRFPGGGSHRDRGRRAEDAGVEWLTERGWQVVARNHSSHWGELDLIAIDDDTLCFVEIKARATARFGAPEAAVTAEKQRRIARCAQAYLAWNSWTGPCRFDVLAMIADRGAWRFHLVRDAFSANS